MGAGGGGRQRDAQAYLETPHMEAEDQSPDGTGSTVRPRRRIEIGSWGRHLAHSHCMVAGGGWERVKAMIVDGGLYRAGVIYPDPSSEI